MEESKVMGAAEDSMTSTEDLCDTLQEELALRKNLDVAFADTQGSHATDTDVVSGVKSRIAHFESKSKNPPVNPVPTQTTTKPAVALSTKGAVAAEKTGPLFKVFLRMRPCATQESVVEVVTPIKNAKETTHKPTKIRIIPSRRLDSMNEPGKEFEFTQVFDQSSTQMEVYQRVASPLVSQLCQGGRIGKSALLFSYGMTNAGKSHTILGDVRKLDSQEQWGIVPRCLQHILQKVSNTDIKLTMSYCEIYNECIYDLLPSASKTTSMHSGVEKPLKICERGGTTIIKGLKTYDVSSLPQGIEMVRKAMGNRSTATNNLNKVSSRSHCICQITVSLDTAKDSESQGKPDSATFWIVDLAGSERSKRTNVGNIRQKEASYINQSMLTLGGCLTRGEKNFRDSKLTILFMHHWMQKGATSMIVNINPAREDYDETKNVLAYAIASKTISVPKPRTQNQGATSRREFDYNGRSKNSSTENPRHDGFKEKEAKLERKRNQESRDKRGGPQVEGRVKRQKQEKTIDEAASVTAATAQQKELSNARAEIETLKQSLEQIETTVRAEISSEVSRDMSTMINEYEKTIHELKAQKMQPKEPENHVDSEQYEHKISELLEQMQDREEEIAHLTDRYSKQHQEDVEKIATLERALKEHKDQLVSVQKSKQELEKKNEKSPCVELETKNEMSPCVEAENLGKNSKENRSPFLSRVRNQKVHSANEARRPRRRLAINSGKENTF